MKKCLTVLFISVILITTYFTQDAKEDIKFSGLMFGDAFYNIDNIDITKKDLDGFQFRRIYITTDYIISEDFDARFRLDADQSSNSLTAGGKLGVMVKNAYLKWKNIFNGSDLFFGISPTPTYAISEAAFEYRALEKTIMDLFGIATSSDFGVDLRGKLNENGTVNYWLKIANNSFNGPETNKYKRFYLNIQLKPSDNFMATLYGDYASQAEKLDPFDNQSKSNNQVVGAVFLNYKQSEGYSIGVESFYRLIQHNFIESVDKPLQNQNGYGISVWARGNISEKVGLVGRFDNFDPNLDASNDAISFYLAGIDFRPAKKVSIIPNVELFTYQGKSSKDLTGRVTFYYKF